MCFAGVHSFALPMQLVLRTCILPVPLCITQHCMHIAHMHIARAGSFGFGGVPRSSSSSDPLGNGGGRSAEGQAQLLALLAPIYEGCRHLSMLRCSEAIDALKSMLA